MEGTRLADPAASRAVLAGIWDYEWLDELPAVANNVTALRDALIDPRVWGLPPEHVRVVEPAAVQAEFIQAIATAAQEATDTVVVYFAGHGIPDDLSDDLYLGLPGTRRKDLDTALRYEFISRRLRLNATNAQHVVIILDCCFSGLALRARMAAGQRLADMAAISSRTVFTASSETKLAMAPEGDTYTAFTGVLLDLLDRGVPDGPELLTMETLHVHAHTRLGDQQPELGSRGAGSLVCVAKNTAFDPAGPTKAPVPGERRSPAPTTPAELPPRLPALVRRLLLDLVPRVKGLAVVTPGSPAPDWLRDETPRLGLGNGEELVAVWRWPARMFFRPQNRGCRVAFTSTGLRVRQGTTLMYFPYADFGRTGFEITTHVHESATSDVFTNATSWTTTSYSQLCVRGADGQTWKSPWVESDTAVLETLCQALERTRALAAGVATEAG
ncbi:caspase domain-containing protein [Streptomyces sp. NPDC090306]|uniref:caspase family protein n=1 Tax=Streptomyces sp. NPDC090306 TaxID=3365961 RepID=UPI003830B281